MSIGFRAGTFSCPLFRTLSSVLLVPRMKWEGAMVEPTIERLYDGVFECPSCEIEYGVERATKDDLCCEQCGEDLTPIDDDEDERADDDNLRENDGEIAARA